MMRPSRSRWHMRGSRPRCEFAPEDLIRGVERDRARFLPEVAIDPSTWQIARLVARTTRGHHGEGLRGLLALSDDGPGTTYWWAAHLASHHQVRLLLRLDADRSGGGIHEVEVNLAEDGDLYIQFGRLDSEWEKVRDALVIHPSIGPLVDGCLARNGRKIRIDHQGRIRITDREIDCTGSIERRRHLLWSAFADEIDGWARSRRRILPDGSPRPVGATLATLRSWTRIQVGWMSHQPMPHRTIRDGRVVLEWRGVDRSAMLIFDGTTMTSRTVVGGVEGGEGPVDVGTPARMHRRAPRIDDLWNYRCAMERK